MIPQIKHLRIVVIAVTGVLLSSCSFINQFAINTLERNIKHAPYDVVIVPGIPYDTAQQNPIFKGRLLWAKTLYDHGIANHIIFSGSAVHTPYVEGTVMKMIADSLGVPTERSFVEHKALSSVQNVHYGMKLAEELGFKKVAVATDPLQTIFIKRYTKKNHPGVAMLPFRFDAMGHYQKTLLPAVDHDYAYDPDFVPRDKRNASYIAED